MDLSRIKALLGDKAIDKLINANVAVIGLGGVGGICAESLVRCGIGNITICDGDIVEPSNVNRQIVATAKNIDQNKAHELAGRFLDINPNLNVNIVDNFWTDESNFIEENDFDYIVDAIDSMKDKIALIVYCKSNDIPIISAMGAGCRVHSNMFYVADVFKTFNDPLAKKVRYELKKAGITSHTVVFSEEKPVKADGVIGSIIFAASACGLLMAEHVVLELTKDEKEV